MLSLISCQERNGEAGNAAKVDPVIQDETSGVGGGFSQNARFSEDVSEVEGAIAIMADYESESFTQVPNWLPRPSHASAASVEEASSRSDGMKNGVVIYSFEMNADQALDVLKKELDISSFSEAATDHPNLLMFTSEHAGRECHIELRNSTPDGCQVAVTYQDKENACGKECLSCSH